MNILVTGANGQLGQCIKEVVDNIGNGNPNHTTADKNYYIFADRSMLDITNKENVMSFIKDNKINIVINCAAYTNVEKAEEDAGNAMEINNDAAYYLAHACKSNGALLIHVSTDYVFDGYTSVAYRRIDEPNPDGISVYGYTKFGGEYEIRTSDCYHLIFRVSSLYSRYGKNFVKSMMKNLKERDEVNVVDYQVMSPTNAHDFAKFLIHIIEDNNATNGYLLKRGVYHFCNHGVCSWYDFTQAIKRCMKDSRAKVNPSSFYPTKAKRPNFSVLNCEDTEGDFDYKIPYWYDSLYETVVKLESDESKGTN